MSLALTHFAFGAALTMLVVAFLLPRLPYPRTLTALGGVWAMVPDAHHVSPVYADFFEHIQDSVYANLFWAHGYLDALDPGDTNEAALLAVAFLLVVTVVVESAQYYFRTAPQRRLRRETRGQSTVTSLGSQFGDRGTDSVVRDDDARDTAPTPVRAVRLLAAVVAVVVGVGLHLLLFSTSSNVGLLAGLGALLELLGLVTVLEDGSVAAWTTAHVPESVRAGAKAVTVVAACLLVLPLVVSLTALSTQAVANAALGAVLVLVVVRL